MFQINLPPHDIPIRLSARVEGSNILLIRRFVLRNLLADLIRLAFIEAIDPGFFFAEARGAKRRGGDLDEAIGDGDAVSAFIFWAVLQNLGFSVVLALGVDVVDDVAHAWLFFLPEVMSGLVALVVPSNDVRLVESVGTFCGLWGFGNQKNHDERDS